MVEHFQVIEPGVTADAVREQVKRILADRAFQASKRYSDMLAYIVERTLDGQYESLKERIIGIEIFERSSDYDTSVDAIVRVAAAEVRKRLGRYYHADGRGNELRIELPVRSYVAEFRQPVDRASEQANPVEELGLPEQTSASRLNRLRARVYGALAACLLLCVGWSLEHVYGSNRGLERFWAPMLQSSGKPVIAIGSPIWLMSPGAAADSIPRPPDSDMTYSQLITHQENYPIADLSAASALTSFLARHQKDSVIRLSDSATLSELHGNPLIVLGSFPNEWALRLGANLPFEFRHNGALQWIEDTSNPQRGKWMVNIHAPYAQVTTDYALVTRAVDKTTGQWWIGIGGVTVLGTNAAQQIIVDPQEIATITAGLPKNWDQKNLQFVVEIRMVKGSPGASQVVAARAW